MKKIKVLLLVAVIMLTLFISGCGLIPDCQQNQKQEHTHDYIFKSTDAVSHHLECECGEIDKSESVHNFKWGNTDNYESAYKECVECGYKQYQKDLYNNPVNVKSSTDYTPGFESIVPFKAYIEKGNFEYNEEFDININIVLDNRYFNEGDFSIKLEESPYYEIVEKKEFVITDFGSQSSDQQVLEFTFRINAVKSCSNLESFDFKVKFNPSTIFLDIASDYPTNDIWYYSPSEEYFLGFRQISFINDSFGMILGDRLKYADKLFYDSINREYLDCIINSEKEYIDRCFMHATNNVPQLLLSPADAYNSNKCFYVSKNVKADFYFTDSFDRLYDKYQSEDPEIINALAKELLSVLYSSDLITAVQYENELNYIDNRGICKPQYGLAYGDIRYDMMIDPEIMETYIDRIVYYEK